MSDGKHTAFLPSSLPRSPSFPPSLPPSLPFPPSYLVIHSCRTDRKVSMYASGGYSPYSFISVSRRDAWRRGEREEGERGGEGSFSEGRYREREGCKEEGEEEE